MYGFSDPTMVVVGTKVYRGSRADTIIVNEPWGVRDFVDGWPEKQTASVGLREL